MFPHNSEHVIDRLPTAPIGATALIGGYGVAVGTGSRALGGIFLAICGSVCVALWARRDGRRTAIALTGVGVGAFALSHVLALLIGAWPAVLVMAAAASGACWRLSDARALSRSPARAGATGTPQVASGGARARSADAPAP
jgi:hypothetical protein